jgi:hypothetical protein
MFCVHPLVATPFAIAPVINIAVLMYTYLECTVGLANSNNFEIVVSMGRES